MYVARRTSMRDERGTTLVELLVAITAGVVVLAAISAVVIAAMRQTARVNTQVDATQRARTGPQPCDRRAALRLHRTRNRPGSRKKHGTELSFLHQTGSAVAPTPILSKITLSGGTLSQSNYAATGGTAPNWTFNEATPSSTEHADDQDQPHGAEHLHLQLLLLLQRGDLPDPARHAAQREQCIYRHPGQALRSPRPLPTRPLNIRTPAANVQNSALLRFSPASYNTSVSNLPCQ